MVGEKVVKLAARMAGGLVVGMAYEMVATMVEMSAE